MPNQAISFLFGCKEGLSGGINGAGSGFRDVFSGLGGFFPAGD